MAETIIGFKELEAKLRELELSMQRKVLVAAAKAGGKIVLDDARSRAPRLTGALAEGITMKVGGRETDSNEATVEIRPSRKTFWALFNEKGTRKMAAQPFMKPALENNRERIAAAVKEQLIKSINKAIRGR